MKLTDRSVRAVQLPPGVADKVFFDDDLGGFGIRVRHSGAKAWIAQYDIGGRTRKVTLGATEVLTAAGARSAAKDIFARVRLGQDPAGDKRAARDEVGETFNALLPRYLEHKRAQLRPRSYVEVERHLLSHCRPLHHRPIAAVDQRTVAILLGKLAETSGPRAANAVRASGSGFFNWLMREGITGTNVFGNTNTAPLCKPRERCPSDSELVAIWHSCPRSDYGDIVRLLILTGARKTEISDLRWSEIDLDAKLISLPAARAKGRRPHEIPLSAPAVTILKSRPRNGRDFVFGRGERGFSGWSKAKLELDAKLGDMPAFVLHDLRRSLSTALHERFHIPPHIVEDTLGHATFRQGVAGVYNKAGYRDEKRRALDLWGEHLAAIVS
jgi:integrase